MGEWDRKLQKMIDSHVNVSAADRKMDEIIQRLDAFDSRISMVRLIGF